MPYAYLNMKTVAATYWSCLKLLGHQLRSEILNLTDVLNHEGISNTIKNEQKKKELNIKESKDIFSL